MAALVLAAPALRGAAGDATIYLCVEDRTAAVLSRATRSVYRYRLPPVPAAAGSHPFTANRINARRELVAGPPQLASPVAIAVDRRGRIYVADDRGPTIFVIEPDESAPTVFYRGARLVQPAALAVSDGGRLYVLDRGLRQIVSVGPNAGEFVTERELADTTGLANPDALFWKSGAIWAIDSDTGSAIRLFASAPTSEVSWLPLRSLRAGETFVFRQLANRRPDPGRMAVSDDSIFVLDAKARRLVAITISEGAPLAVDLGPSLPDPAAIAITDSAMYFVDRSNLVLRRAPALAAVTAYFEAGLPSENVTAFYQFLARHQLLPLQTYVLQPNDNIAAIVTSMNLLPGPFTTTFQTLFCSINPSFCQGETVPDRYYPGRTVLLPDVQPTRYLGRRAETLPVDVKTSESHPPLHLASLAQVTQFFAPLTALQPDTLLDALRTLNYSYSGDNLLKETSGTYIVPVDAMRFRALVPRNELADPFSDLNKLASKNVKILPASTRQAAKSVEGTETQPPVLTANQPGLPWLVTPENDARCETYDPRVYTRIDELIHYCVPKGAQSTTIGIIDNRFDPTHPEFQVAGKTPPQSRLSLFQMQTANVQRNPLTDDTAQNFDIAIDHGTHVAGLIASRNATGQIAGTHPSLRLIATDAEHAKDMLDQNWGVRICNVSLGSARLGGGGVANDIKVLYSLISDKAYSGILFVVSAGNEGQRVTTNMLSGLGSQSNVIVVAASSFERLPAIAPYSNYDWRFVHIVAPGNLVKSAIFGGGYGLATGTSQATAFVSGTAALLAHAGVPLEPWQIKERIISTADLWVHANGNSDKVFSGMLNMKRALLDTDGGVFQSFADHRTVKGNISPTDAARVVLIRKPGTLGERFRYGDLRRMTRNSDGTFNFVYATQPDSNDRLTRQLQRLTDVPAEWISDDVGRQLQFVITESDGSTETIDLLALEDLVNAIS